MATCSSYFYDSWAFQRDRENIEKYGTSDLDVIELIEKYNDKKVEQRAEQLAEEKAEAHFDAIKNDFKLAILKEAEEKFLVKKGNLISTSSPFITEYVDVNGQRLFRQDFIPDTFRRDPEYSEKQLVRNAFNGHWQRTFKTKGLEFVSDVDVLAALIINARGPNDCSAYVIYIRGRDAPVYIKNGNLSTANIIKALLLEATSLDEKWVAESFRRSLCMCPNIFFFTSPEHMGGCKLLDGSLIYVSSQSVIPGLEKLFSDAILEHKLLPHENEFKTAIKNYKEILPPSWKAKFMVVERVKSILLPWFKNYGLIDDRISIIVYRSEEDKIGCIALAKRINYESTCVNSLMDKDVDVKKILEAANDIPVIFTFSLAIESRRNCSQQFTDIMLDLKRENGIEHPTRKTIILLTETPARIPEGLPAVQLTIDEKIAWGDIKELQRLSGQFDYSLIEFFYKNKFATNDLISNEIKEMHRLSRDRDFKLPSKSVLMDLVTAALLKELGIVEAKEFNAMLGWLTAKKRAVTSSSEALCHEIANIASDAICRGEIQAAWQDGQYPSWNPSRIFIGNDGKYNFTPELFRQKITSRMKGTDSFNKCCQALEKQCYSNPNRSGEHTSTLRVYCESIGRLERNFISLAPNLFSAEARMIVEQGLVSDLFYQIDKVPRMFYPLILHNRFKLVAGQVINNYNAINPFVAISGSPGSGKTDLLMMQALQRAKAGDTVIILDPTNSFCEYEWAQHKVPKEIVDETVVFWDMSEKGWLVNIIDFTGCSTVQQKRERLFSILMSGSHLTGCNQISILMNAVNVIINKIENGETNLYNCVVGAFENKAPARKVMNRVLSMFSTIAIEQTDYMSWEDILGMRGKVIVVSTGNATVKADVNPLDVILDSFYSYKDSHRAGNVTLVLDEIQTMNLNEGAPIDIVLSKGRKLNISAFLASQRYSNGKDRLGRVFDYCDTKLFFTPMESCIEAVSAKTHIPVDVLRCFEQGECAFIGPAYSEHMGKNVPVTKAVVGKTYRPPYVGNYDKNN